MIYYRAVTNVDMHEIEIIFRAQLGRILESVQFSSSPQVRQFLVYVSEAALNGREHLNQVEIAEQALGKTGDFNPIDDASVRRVATLARQKLQHYYTSDGRDDPVIITLPVRSYVPIFRFRENAEPESAGAPKHRRQHRRVTLAVVAVGTALAFAAALAIYRTSPARNTGVFECTTARGTIENKALALPGACLRLGPRISTNEDVSVRLQFTPEQVYQQAGLMIYQSPDQYVKLGRHFSGRVYWEFGIENRGKYLRPPGIWTYDPLGQTGVPQWLLIRRRGQEFRAFVSGDGYVWQPVGNTLVATEPMSEARVGLYAFNGQANARTIPARFDHLGTGITFAALSSPGDWPPPGWSVHSNCPEVAKPELTPNALELRYPAEPCIWQMSRPKPAGDWVITTKLDLLPFSGAVAGLIVEGAKGRLRLVRWALNGGSVAVEFPPGNQVAARTDFPGSPPLVLRLECIHGIVRGSFSRDESNFESLPADMYLDELGGDVHVGLTTQLTSWNQAEVPPSPRFFFVRQEIGTLVPFR